MIELCHDRVVPMGFPENNHSSKQRQKHFLLKNQHGSESSIGLPQVRVARRCRLGYKLFAESMDRNHATLKPSAIQSAK
jgi:hypothetical protein